MHVKHVCSATEWDSGMAGESRAVGFIGFVNFVCICVVWMGYVICMIHNSCLALLQVVFLKSNRYRLTYVLRSLPVVVFATSAAAVDAVPNKDKAWMTIGFVCHLIEL